MVHALASDRTYDPLWQEVLPGTSRRGDHFLNTKGRYPISEMFSVDVVAIADQKPWSSTLREGLKYLLRSKKPLDAPLR